MNLPYLRDLLRRPSVYVEGLPSRIKSRIFAFGRMLLGGTTAWVDTLVNLEPLPEWTNKQLTLFMVALWGFAISLSWFADSLTYVVSGLVILGLWSAAIFYRVEDQR